MNLIKASLIMAISSLVTIKAADVLFSQLSYGISDGFVSLSRERSIVLREYSPNQKANIFAGPDYIQSASALESQKVLLTID